MLEYKANWNDRPFVKIDRWFPSSKSCSTCGWITRLNPFHKGVGLCILS
ncbi:zinc ribbon domain-containing protein [Algoriphagus resistens]